jgi:DNA-binding IclR family transcriptional regulator
VKRVSSQETVTHTTRTVERACAVLSAFSSAEPQLSLGELASRVGLPKATAHRLAGSLVATGFLEHHDDGRYALGLKLSELGALVRSELDVVTVCSPAVDSLAAVTRETVLLGAANWETLELTVVAARVSPQQLSVVPMTGQRMTIPPGCLGKALLLGLPAAEAERVIRKLPLPALTSKTHTDRARLATEIARARVVGFALAEEEYLEGVSGVGVPVMFEDDRPRATIGVVGPSSRIGGELERIGKLALELTSDLRPTPTTDASPALTTSPGRTTKAAV